MKNNYLKYLLIFSTVIVSFSSCKKYLDVNQNPNAANEPPIDGLLAQGTHESAINTFDISDYTSYFVQYLASPSVGSDKDTYGPTDPTTSWGDIYNILTDLHDMRNLAQQRNLIAYKGVADILTAYNLSMAINFWGDVPYSEAFVGVDNLKPKYDDQKALYDTCMALIDTGIADMQQPEAVNQLTAASDFIHKGVAAAWVKTAYALKARLLNEVSKTGQYDPNKVLDALSHAYTSNDDDAQVTAFVTRNPWATVAINNAGLLLDGWLSSYFVNSTNGDFYGIFDPRLPQITDTTKFGDYRGTPNGTGFQGKANSDSEECYIAVNKFYSSTNSPLMMLTYKECKFIEAEADFRAGNKADAYTAYLAAIQASMDKLGVSASASQNYMKNSKIAVGETGLTLEMIMEQKYIAEFLNPVTWDDMRRFDYSYMHFSMPQNAVPSTFIRRVSYPSTETTRNGANVPNVQQTDPLWWDK